MGKKGIVRAAWGMLAASFVVAASPAQAVERELYFENACAHPVRVLVSHAYDEDSWDAHGWYEFTGNEDASQLVEDDEPLTQLDDHQMFIYAETTDGSDIFWEGTDHYETFNEISYGMMRPALEVISGDLHVRLVCDGQ